MSTDRTPNGTSDLLDREDAIAAALSVDNAAVASPNYTIDDDEDDDVPPTDPSAAARGQDPDGMGEREPSSIKSAVAAASSGGEVKTGKYVEKEAKLAEKTSKIMSDYQAYLAEIETEFPTSNDSPDEAVAKIKSVRGAYRDAYKDYDEGGTFPRDGDAETGDGGEEGQLYRGWSYKDDGGSSPHLVIDRTGGGVADFEDHPHAMMSRGRKSGGRSLHFNSRVKKGLCMVAVASALIGTIVGVTKSKKEKNLPDWEGEYAEIEAEAANQQAASQSGNSNTNHSGGSGMHPRPTHKPHTPPSFPTHQNTNSQQFQEDYEEAAVTFHPNLYDRSKGWNGQTYLEALEFCESQSMALPCPYSAICPDGPGSKPLGGNKDEGSNGSFVPMIDGPNQWVSVSTDESCVKYETMFQSLPEWGNTGEDNEDMTRHVFCCDRAAVDAAEEAMAVASSASSGNSSSGGSPPTPVSAPTPAQGPGMTEEQMKPYEVAAVKYQPKWFDRSKGWEGQTFLQAVDFCGKIENYMVCPYEGVCPLGMGSEPMGGFRDVDDYDLSWVPVSDKINSWVSVGTEQPCLPFSYTHNDMSSGPQWGLDGRNDEAFTRNVACCLKQSAPATATAIESVEDAQDATTNTGATTAADAIMEEVISGNIEPNSDQEKISKVYETISTKFQPLWFDRSKGWTGRTYLEGLTFCAVEQGERVVCPLEALCPLGPGSSPSGGQQGDLSWAPVSNKVNEWLSVGNTDSCVLYSYIHGDQPQWGLDGKDNADITSNIACCLDSSVVGGNPSAADTTTVAVTTTSPPTTSTIATPVTPSPTPLKDNIVYQEEELYAAIETALEPLWFDRSSGWTGQAYLPALQFCATKDSRVPCPYTAVCPGGSGMIPMGGFKESGSYAPIVNNPNSWVSISTDRPCELYSNLHGTPPEWGLTGSNEEATRHVACCLDIEGVDDGGGVVSDTGIVGADTETEPPVTVNDPPFEFTEDEQAILDLFKPQWYGKQDGYRGTTYEDAGYFCKNVAGASLCPLEGENNFISIFAVPSFEYLLLTTLSLIRVVQHTVRVVLQL